MSEVSLTIWDFKSAPSDMRAYVPARYELGWVACLRASRGVEVVDYLKARNSSHIPIFCLEVEDGSVILAGANIEKEGSSE